MNSKRIKELLHYQPDTGLFLLQRLRSITKAESSQPPHQFTTTRITMETTTPDAADISKPKCPQCYKPIETPVKRRIFGRGYNPVTRKQFAETRDMEFCSEQCGLHHQYSLEG